MSTKRGSLVNRFLIEEALRESPEAKSIVEKYPELEWISDYKSFQFSSYRLEKQAVIFAGKRGAWLKPFHCYHQNAEYSYFSLDVAEGCLFDCVYCYLQSYLSQQSLVVFLRDATLEHELQQCRERNLWISTGLLSDSLLAEKYYRLLPALSRLLPEGAILDLRTKSDDVSVLTKPEICRNQIVVSWSVNPDQIARQYEYRAPSLDARLKAARHALDLGYRIGWHLDPIFHFSGWESAYADLLKKIGALSCDRVAFISVGLFRYMPDLGSVIRRRFPNHAMLSGEFFPDQDGKYHYLRAIRKEIYRSFERWLTPWREKVPIFWSMEPDDSLIGS